MSKIHWFLALAAALLLVGGLSAGDVAAEDNAPDLVIVKLGPLGDAVKVKGAIAPATFERVACEPEAFGGPFEIVEAAPEGRVVKGQVLVRFDDATYREQLVARERDVELARIKLQKTELDDALRVAETATAMEDAVRKKRLADESLERFETVERKLLEQSKIYAFHGRQIQIKNMREELAQLEKMYKEDDLTEETEEIVLKRNRRNFERMLESFERTKVRHEYDMKVDLPRRHQSLRLSARKAAQGLERFQKSLPLDDAKRKLDLEKAREGLAKAEEQLVKFRADGALLSVKAPIAGYAVRGSFSGSSWSSLPSAEAYAAGKKMKARQTLFTVLDESSLHVTASISEAELPFVKTGQAATVTTKATGKQGFEAEVAVVARYGSDGKHAIKLRVKQGNPMLRAGMSCLVAIPKPQGDDVLTVPAGCVQMEDGQAFVFVMGDDGAARTEVKLGRKAGGRVVITSGVKAGARVLAQPPVEKE